MEEYSLCEHNHNFVCLGKQINKPCYGILAKTSDLGSSSNEIDIETDQILEYLRDSYAVDINQRFHYEFKATSNILDGTGKIKFAKIKIDQEQVETNSLEFKLLCSILKMDEEGKMKISPENLQTYTILQNSFLDAGKWID